MVLVPAERVAGRRRSGGTLPPLRTGSAWPRNHPSSYEKDSSIWRTPSTRGIWGFTVSGRGRPRIFVGLSGSPQRSLFCPEDLSRTHEVKVTVFHISLSCCDCPRREVFTIS
ncbi:hypothetical protein PSPO01_13988 [Paraphaeosphaeria sporulosa]